MNRMTNLLMLLASLAVSPHGVSGRDAVVKFFGSRSKTPTCIENLHVDLVRHVGFADGKADEHWDPPQKS
jgi:predicted SnoaL-like aldol condensation-catalyzing enzyme